MSLPALVKDRLIRRDSIDTGLKKSNEYRVREYIKNYLKDLEEIIWILDTLPDKQFKKLFKDEDVYRLLEITERAIVNLDFVPIQRNAEGKLIAAKTLNANSTDVRTGNQSRPFSVIRDATELDKDRHSTLQKHISRLEKFVRSFHHAIFNDLDRIYLKDLIIKAKKEGYEPVTLPERDRFIPRLTPEQYHFQELQGTLMGLGFRHIEYQSDIEILKEAMRTEEGKTLLKKFRSLQEDHSPGV